MFFFFPNLYKDSEIFLSPHEKPLFLAAPIVTAQRIGWAAAWVPPGSWSPLYPERQSGPVSAESFGQWNKFKSSNVLKKYIVVLTQ